MPWSGGTFTRVHDWTDDEGAAIDMEASRFDAEDDNFETGINSCLHKAGQNAATGDLDLGSYRLTTVGAATALTDAPIASQIISQALTYYVDSGSADTYVITPSPAISAYAEGQRFVFRATNANSGASTLNVNSLGAIAIQRNDGSALSGGEIVDGGYYEAVYDSNSTPDRWVLVSPASVPPDINNSNWSGTDLSVANGGTGASTLTGLLRGNGTSAITGSATINDDDWSGTDLEVANGGTGSSTASAARTALGIAIDSDVQGYSAALAQIAALADTNGNFIVGNGSAWVAESGSTARASLGLGSLATASAVNNGDWSGTDLAVTNGGTGASDAGTARTNLGLGSIATADVTAQSGGSPSGGSNGDIFLIY